MNELRRQVLAELFIRYTALPDGYRRYVNDADEPTLERVLELALDDAPGREISDALGIDLGE